jgi:hypothetical protein
MLDNICNQFLNDPEHGDLKRVFKVTLDAVLVDFYIQAIHYRNFGCKIPDGWEKSFLRAHAEHEVESARGANGRNEVA